MTGANIITSMRIVLLPFLLVILLTEMNNKEIIAFIIFIIAAITDALDGWWARKFNQVSDLGKFLDPLADKLLVTGVLLALINMNLVETWIASIIILREIFMAGFRLYFLMKDDSFSATWLAKLKTIFQVVSISILILCRRTPFPDVAFKIGTILLYLAALLSIYSAIHYIVKFYRASKG